MKSKKPFDFFTALNGRELMHWTGIPCFISKEDKKDPVHVEITTWDGRIFSQINVKELFSMAPEEMNFV